MNEEFNYEHIEFLREYFNTKVETGTQLPNVKDVVDGTEFILVEDAIRTPHKMIVGKWHRMVVDVNSIVRYEEI